MTVVALDPGLIYTEMLLCSLGKVASNYQSPQEWYGFGNKNEQNYTYLGHVFIQFHLL